MGYQEFRQNCNIGEFISDIYVEARGNDNQASIVGYFLIRDHFEKPEYLPINPNEPEFFNAIFAALNDKAPSYWVYCDRKLTHFKVGSFPYCENDFSNLDANSYTAFIESLGNVQLSGKSARPPRYPNLLTSYSLWHYSLDWVCKCRDLDYIEVRKGLPVAILEVTGRLKDESHLKNSLHAIRERLVLQQRIMSLTGVYLQVRSFFVLHTTDLNCFYVYENDWSHVGRFDSAGYEGWLRGL